MTSKKCMDCGKTATRTVPASWWAPAFVSEFPADVPCCDSCYNLVVSHVDSELAALECQVYRLGE